MQRSNAIARADKKQRDLGEYMLNNPVRPYKEHDPEKVGTGFPTRRSCSNKEMRS